MMVYCFDCEHVEIITKTCEPAQYTTKEGKKITTSEVGVRAHMFASARGDPNGGFFDDWAMNMGIETPCHKTIDRQRPIIKSVNQQHAENNMQEKRDTLHDFKASGGKTNYGFDGVFCNRNESEGGKF